jgi:hypothetical protein
LELRLLWMRCECLASAAGSGTLTDDVCTAAVQLLTEPRTE